MERPRWQVRGARGADTMLGAGTSTGSPSTLCAVGGRCSTGGARSSPDTWCAFPQLLAGIGGIEVLENACRVDAVFDDIVAVSKLISWLTREPNAMQSNVLSRREVAMLLAMWNMQDAATVHVRSCVPAAALGAWLTPLHGTTRAQGAPNLMTPFVGNKQGMAQLRRAVVGGLWGCVATLVTRLRPDQRRLLDTGPGGPEREALRGGAQPL